MGIKAKLNDYMARRFLVPEGGVASHTHFLLIPIKSVSKVPGGGTYKKLKAGETYRLTTTGSVRPHESQSLFDIVAWLEVNPELLKFGFPNWTFREVLPKDAAPDLTVLFTCVEDMDISKLDWLVRVTTEGGTYRGWQ